MDKESPITPTSFFPRNKKFWIYNSAGWGLIILISIGEFLVNRGLPGELARIVAIVDGLFIYFAGTCAGLIFRRRYYQCKWHESTFMQTLSFTLPLALISAMLITGIALLFIYVIGAVPDRFLSSTGEFQFLMNFIGNSVSVFFLVLFWCQFYFGIKGAQNSRLFSLKALQLENSLKEARLNALAGQINPHFLFNALNNIRFMIHEDAQKADDSLTSLAEILRYSLDSSKRDKIELSLELTIVRQYLALMENQMEGRLNFSITSEPSIEKYLIPPMTVQMLAENAIKHGIDRQKAGGSITIECSAVNERLSIKVHNTVTPGGAEFDIPIAQKKNQENHKENDQENSGLGLQNITKRLALLYGDEAQLSLSNFEDQVLVTIDLPLELSFESAT